MKNLSFAILLFMLCISSAWATPTINGTPVSVFNLNAETVTASVTVAAGSNRLAIITVSALRVTSGGIGTGASVVFNTSENATFIGGSYGTFTAIEQWYLKMPSVTTANFVATWTPVVSTKFLAISVVVLDGAMQTGTPHRTQTCQSDEVGTTQPDLNVQAVSGDLSIDGITSWNDAITDPDGGQTERTDEFETISADTNSLNTSTETATDTVTEMGWTKSGSDNYSQYCGVSIIPAAAGASSSAVPVFRRRR